MNLPKIPEGITSKKALLFASGFFLSVLVIGSASVTMANQDRVILGVQSEGKSLAGLSKEELHSHFEKVNNAYLNRKTAVLTYDNRQWDITPQDIDLTIDVDAVTEKVYQMGRNQNVFMNLLTQLQCAVFGQTVPSTGIGKFNDEKLTSKLASIKKDIDVQPSNASVQLKGNGALAKTAAVTGATLDAEELHEFLSNEFQALHLTVQKELEPALQAPFVTDKDLASMDGVLGSYSTTYYPGDRGDNITIAAQKLHGALVRPQATLSFNQVVGHRTREAGYKNAGVIVDGTTVNGIGGGVCQVSSTLYNAILLAGLTSVERTNHSLLSSYVPAGRDATVADDLLDFVFRNPLPHPISLYVANSGRRLTIYVLGTKADLNQNTISLVTEGYSKRPSVYRIWKQNGTVVNKEFLHTDTYQDAKS